MNLSPLPVLMIIPTGIGCSIGGYAGDAIPCARLLAAASGCLITHPNVMNGAVLYWSDSRIQYVEGFGIDQFAVGDILLHPVRQQKIGLLLDAGLEEEIYHRHVQVAEGCRASLGLKIGPIIKTDIPLEVDFNHGFSEVSWGGIKHPDALIRGGEKLKELGATAIAVVSRFPDDSNDEAFELYRLGKGVDPFAGAEAVISHLLVKYLSIPCAHAPALSSLPVSPDIDPRTAAEELGYTFLPSVLVGLSRAPDLISKYEIQQNNDFLISSSNYIKVDDLGAVIAPQGGLGGVAVLACLERGIPLIAVSNPGVLNVTSSSLGLKSDLKLNNLENCLHVANYIEAAGVVLALREGIDISTLKRPLKSVDLDSNF